MYATVICGSSSANATLLVATLHVYVAAMWNVCVLWVALSRVYTWHEKTRPLLSLWTSKIRVGPKQVELKNSFKKQVCTPKRGFWLFLIALSNFGTKKQFQKWLTQLSAEGAPSWAGLIFGQLFRTKYRVFFDMYAKYCLYRLGKSNSSSFDDTTAAAEVTALSLKQEAGVFYIGVKHGWLGFRV